MPQRKISDHSSFAGKNDSRLGSPMGNAFKKIPSNSDGYVSASDYPDTTEALARSSSSNTSKLKAKASNPYRRSWILPRGAQPVPRRTASFCIPISSKYTQNAQEDIRSDSMRFFRYPCDNTRTSRRSKKHASQVKKICLIGLDSKISLNNFSGRLLVAVEFLINGSNFLIA